MLHDMLIAHRHARPLLTELRLATAAAHTRVEQQLILDGWTRLRYRAFLRATLAVLEPTVPRVVAHVGEQSFPLLSSSLPRLRSDLESLGGSDRPMAPPPLPRIADEAEAFGAAYVLHGSLLGGATIARSLESAVGLSSSTLSYLRPPADVGDHWRAFTRALDAWGQSVDREHRSRAVATALGMFDAFAHVFARAGVE